MKKRIEFMAKGQNYSFANTWDEISPYCYSMLIKDFARMCAGELSPAMVRVNYVCNTMGWKLGKMDHEARENVAMLAEQVTFPFVISYPDNDAALQDMDKHTSNICKRIPPERLNGVAIARYLSRLEYHFSPDCCFCKQLVPVVEVRNTLYSGYKIDTSFNMLTTSLTALQYIEARELIGCNKDMLPLLAAILYYPEAYDSEGAHKLAFEFVDLPEHELQAIAFNFQAFNNYLFTQTGYSILTQGKDEKPKAISTGARESLYNLSGDGLGDIYTLEHMNLITYLSIMRKKLIESVKSMHAAEMKLTDISTETGLSIHLLKQII